MKDNDSLKNKVRQETPLPQGFSWEEMSSGISSKLSVAESKDPSKAKRRYKIIYLLLFLILGIGGCYKMLNNQKDILNSLPPHEGDYNLSKDRYAQEVKQKKTNISDIDNVSQDDIKANKTTNFLNQKQITSHLEQNNTPSEGSSTLLSSLATSKDQDEQEVIITKSSNDFISSTIITAEKSNANPSDIDLDPIKKTTSSRDVLDKKNAHKFDKAVTVSSPINESESLIYEGNQSKTSSQNDEFSIIQNSDNAGIIHRELQYLPLQIITSLDATRDLIFPKLELDNLIPVRSTFNSEWGMSIGMGSNYMTQRYENTLSGLERNNNDVSIPGITAVVSLDYRFTKSLGLFTGLHWNRHFSEFNFIHNSSTQLLREDQIVEIRTSVLTGQVSNIIADVLRNVKNKRTVRHFNKIDQWTFPLGIQLYQGGRRLEYNLGVGGLLSLQRGQVGKTLLNGEIIEYGPENQIHSQRLSYGIISGIGMRYNLGKGYFFGTSINMSKSLSNWSSELDQRLNPTIINGLFSIGMKM